MTDREAMAQPFHRFAKVTIAAGAATALVLGLGTGKALAYFTGAGQGSGHASVANGDLAVTIGTSATIGTKLYPGGTADLVITATNPNNVAVRITALTLGAASGTGCTTPAISLTSPTTSYLPVTIPANSNASIVIAGALTMGTTASSNCQGVSFSIPLSSVTVQQ